MKAHLRRWLDRAGYVVFRKRDAASYARDGLFTLHRHPFLNDATFRKAYARGVQASAGYDPSMEWRVHVALWAARLALTTKGDFVECGVNAGFVSSAIMEALEWDALDRTFYLIDTFNGPVAAQFSEDESAKLEEIEKAVARGSYVTDLSRVIENFEEWPRVEFVQGEVPRVLPDSGVRSVAFLHIDMNCALPEREALRYFWPLLSDGGVVLFDDYTYFGHDALTVAIDAVAAEIGASVLALPTGQGLIVKR